MEEGNIQRNMIIIKEQKRIEWIKVSVRQFLHLTHNIYLGEDIGMCMLQTQGKEEQWKVKM